MLPLFLQGIGSPGSSILTVQPQETRAHHRAAGYGFIIAILAGGTQTPQGAEYQFGLHAQAIYERNTTRSVFPSVRTPPTATGAILKTIVAAPEQRDFTIQAQVFAVPLAGGWIVTSASGEPQFIDYTAGGQIFKPVTATVVTPNPIARFFAIAPQSDPTPIAAKVFASLVAAPIVPNPIARFFTTVPQIEDRVRNSIFLPLSGQTPPVIMSLYAAPQLIDLSLRAVIVSPALAPVAVSYAIKQLSAAPQLLGLTQQGWIKGTSPPLQGRVPPITQGAPQQRDLTLKALLTPSAKTQPILGPTIRQFVVPPQPNLNLNYSAVFTPSVYRTGATPPETPTARQILIGRERREIVQKASKSVIILRKPRSIH